MYRFCGVKKTTMGKLLAFPVLVVMEFGKLTACPTVQ
jgi:hypothetical protein